MKMSKDIVEIAAKDAKTLSAVKTVAGLVTNFT
jgi:hypothetical protein